MKIFNDSIPLIKETGTLKIIITVDGIKKWIIFNRIIQNLL